MARDGLYRWKGWRTENDRPLVRPKAWSLISAEAMLAHEKVPPATPEEIEARVQAKRKGEAEAKARRRK